MKRIFTFWEPKKNIPAYLQLCLKTWQKFLPEYEIVILDYENLKDWLGEDYYSKFLYDHFALPIQTDAIRCAVLKKYGGIWMDVDTIITNESFRQKIEELNTEFSLIVPHICFIYGEKNTEILVRWEKRIKKRLEFCANVYKYDMFSVLYLKTFRNKLYKHLKNWSFLGNDILNNILSKMNNEAKYFPINRDELHSMPELEYEKASKKPVKSYKKFYFQQELSDYALQDNGGIILLHNSWTPKEFMNMSEKEFLAQNNTLAKIFQKILT